MVTGNVNTHANSMFVIVFRCKFFNPFFATILPMMPELNICVVLTGALYAVATPIPMAATISADAPCA